MNQHDTSAESSIPSLTLFVTGDAPRSRRARSNLAKALKALTLEKVQPLEIDLIAQPEQTVTYSVFATPALLKTDKGGGVSMLYGDLSDQDKLHHFLADIADDAE